MDWLRSIGHGPGPRARLCRFAAVRLRLGRITRRATAPGEWLARLGDLSGRRRTAQTLAPTYVAQAAPHRQFSLDRRFDGQREFVSEHRVEILRGQGAARRDGASGQRTARID